MRGLILGVSGGVLFFLGMVLTVRTRRVADSLRSMMTGAPSILRIGYNQRIVESQRYIGILRSVGLIALIMGGVLLIAALDIFDRR